MNHQTALASFLRRSYSIFLASSAFRFSSSTLLRSASYQSALAFTKSL